jgi:hypothetical protein
MLLCGIPCFPECKQHIGRRRALEVRSHAGAWERGKNSKTNIRLVRLDIYCLFLKAREDVGLNR